MAKKIVAYENNCVGCETCISCGRDKEIPVYEYSCDGCGDTECKDIYGYTELYKFNGLMLCKECLLYEWLKTSKTEQIQAKLLEFEVEDSLKEDFEKVNTEEE